MFKKRLFGYSQIQTHEILKEIENDFHTEEEILLDKIKRLEEKCKFLEGQKEADNKKLDEAIKDYSYFMKVMSDVFKRKSASQQI